MVVKTIFTTVLIALILLGPIAVIILGAVIRNYYTDKVHGIHQTNFTFTGEYVIKTVVKGNHDVEIYYMPDCQATTQYGECHYKCPKSTIYLDAENYAITHCINDTTLDGYIITEKDRCVIPYPNDSIREALIAFYIISAIVGFTILCIVCIVLANNIYDKFKIRNTEIDNIQV
jgi:hypothetical protein